MDAIILSENHCQVYLRLRLRDSAVGLLVVKNFCTDVHKYPQRSGEIPLAKFSGCSYYAHRLIGEKNFTSQFREGGKGKTESASIELNEKCELRNSIQQGGEGQTEPTLNGLDSEEKRHNSMRWERRG